MTATDPYARQRKQREILRTSDTTPVDSRNSLSTKAASAAPIGPPACPRQQRFCFCRYIAPFRFQPIFKSSLGVQLVSLRVNGERNESTLQELLVNP